MRMSKKKLRVLSTAFILGLSSVIATAGVEAASVNDLENKKKQIEEKQSGLDSDITSTKEKIEKLQKDQHALEAEIKRIDLAVEETSAKIREKNTEITETKEDIEQLKAEIAELKERIEKRSEVLKKRAVTLQENGGQVSYLEVLLGSSSFADFVSRVNAVSTILEADEDLIKQHESDKAELESSQKKVEDKLTQLEDMKAELVTMKEELSAQKAEKDQLMAALETEEDHAHNHVLSLEEETEILNGQTAAIEKAIAEEKERIAAEQKRQAELEEARKKAKETAASSGGSGSSNSGSSNSGGSSSKGSSSNVSAPSVSAGNFTRPASGRLSSGFGARWGKTHAGVDIANAADVPVVAAANGVVSRSYYSSSYGNCIIITHSINGQIYTTLYAHLENRNVSTGQSVSKGQQIGIMGNTGRSTGQHLHFELHKGPWTVSKSNAINPVGIVPL